MLLSTLPNRTVALERQNVNRDLTGSKLAPTWTNKASFLCLIEPASAHTTSEYARRNIRVTDRIYTNKDFDASGGPGVRPGDRVNDAGTFYVIHGVQPYNSSLGATKVVVLDSERLIT